MSGSCALNLCGIACGRLDLFYELGFGGPWYDFILFKWSDCFAGLTLFAPLLRDVAGGAVIVKEAGGLVYDP